MPILDTMRNAKKIVENTSITEVTTITVGPREGISFAIICYSTRRLQVFQCTV